MTAAVGLSPLTVLLDYRLICSKEIMLAFDLVSKERMGFTVSIFRVNSMPHLLLRISLRNWRVFKNTRSMQKAPP